MNNAVDIFTDFYYESVNEELANQLYKPCFEILTRCAIDIRYENGVTTYLDRDPTINNFNNWNISEFYLFLNWLRPHVYLYLEKAKLKKTLNYTITSAWISRIDKYGSHEFHVHSGGDDHISGNFYVNAPAGSSSFTFLRSDYYNDPWKHLPTEKWSQENSLEWHIPAEKGKLLLWKSNLFHGVRLNKVDNRIAISFNIKLHD